MSWYQTGKFEIILQAGDYGAWGQVPGLEHTSPSELLKLPIAGSFPGHSAIWGEIALGVGSKYKKIGQKRCRKKQKEMKMTRIWENVTNISDWQKFYIYYILYNLYILIYIERSVSCSVVPNSLRPHGLQPTRLLCPWDFPGKDTGVGCYFLLQGTFPTQGSNPDLLHCRHILYRLSHHWGRKVIGLLNKARPEQLITFCWKERYEEKTRNSEVTPIV